VALITYGSYSSAEGAPRPTCRCREADSAVGQKVADTASAFLRSFPIWLKVPVAGSYISTELIDCELSELRPPR